MDFWIEENMINKIPNYQSAKSLIFYIKNIIILFIFNK